MNIKSLFSFGIGLLAAHSSYSMQSDKSLFTALEEGSLEEVVHGINEETVRLVDEDGNTVLHAAAEKGHLEIVKQCVSKGAEVDGRNVVGRRYQDSCCTPLHLAARNGHAGVVTFLLGVGAQKEALDEYLHTPLHNASWKNHLGCLQALLTAKANVDTQDIRGGTGLHWASLDGFHDIIRALLAAGARPTFADKRGHLPLHHAAYRGFPDCVQTLIEVDKDSVEVLDYQGHTPLSRAKWAGQLACLNLLMAHTSNLNEEIAIEDRMICSAVQKRDLKTLIDWFDAKLAQEKGGVSLHLQGGLVKMSPGFMSISREVQKRFKEGKELAFPAISEGACTFINDHIRGLYILSVLHGIIGMRGPKVFNGLANTIKRDMFIGLHGNDALTNEVAQAADQLGIPVLSDTIDLFKDECSSRC